MIVITGGSGFFGSNLARFLMNKGEQVRIFDIQDPEPDVARKAEFVRGDITNYEDVKNAFEGASAVYHTVALVPISRAGNLFEKVNVGGTRNALEATVEQGIKKFVHISTSAVYGIPKDVPCTEKTKLQPLGHYGHAKFRAEVLCKEYREKGLKTTILRPRCILGPGRMGIFQVLFEWVRDGKKIYIIGTGENRYQMLSTYDLCNACFLAAKKGLGEDFNVGADEFLTVRGDLEGLISHAGTKSKVTPLPTLFVKPALDLLDKMKMSPIVEWHYMTGDKDFIFDTAKAKKKLGWSPKYSNVEMLAESYDWYIKNYKRAEHRSGTTHRDAPRQGVLKLVKRLS